MLLTPQKALEGQELYSRDGVTDAVPPNSQRHLPIIKKSPRTEFLRSPMPSLAY
jgi:hypothetical protein